MMRKKSKKAFISDAIRLHSAKYEYSEVEYVNNYTKVKILCRVHGAFFQTPKNHLCGKGCKLCSYLKTGERCKSSTECFISQARKIHGNRYDYSRVNYKNNHTYVDIVCLIHGDFKQLPSNHLRGYNCIKCGYAANSLSTQLFVERSIIVHGELYDYSKADYVNNATNVEIICKNHGSFYQTPANHMIGQRCPKCVPTRFSEKAIQWLESVAFCQNIIFVTPKITENITYRAPVSKPMDIVRKRTPYSNFTEPIIMVIRNTINRMISIRYLRKHMVSYTKKP